MGSFVESLTPEQAAYVRRIRVEQGASWRVVAGLFHQTYGHDYPETPDGQPIGEDLCEVAAAMHGEHYLEPPWN